MRPRPSRGLGAESATPGLLPSLSPGGSLGCGCGPVRAFDYAVRQTTLPNSSVRATQTGPLRVFGGQVAEEENDMKARSSAAKNEGVRVA
jgi:hypothetical protein